MLKIVLSLLLMFIVVQASDYSRANAAAKEAFKGLDCDFDDCPKEVVKPKVVIQEKVVYVDRPVEVEKEVVVEKVVYVDKPVVVEKIVEVEKPVAKVEPVKAVTGRTYDKAFFDVHTKSQAPMLDYIKYTSRGSFDVAQFADTVSKIRDEDIEVYIHGSIAVPDSIKTEEVYVNVGPKYYSQYYSYWLKQITYNGSKSRQNSDYFLVATKVDSSGNRYVEYKIQIHLDKPWKVTPAEENYAPNTFNFKMAPKTRGFKNKFVVARPYITEE